ncbi:MAG: GAF domain-containing protein, partial [Rhodoferax sp.]|nr:GAF domain-containing protein [Actinomycetota bacterium]
MSTKESGPRPEDLALLRLLQMPRARHEELLAVPAEYALERLGAASVSLSRWERDRGLVRTVVNVGALAPSEVRFPQDEVFDLATYEELLDRGRGIGVAYDHHDPDLSYVGADLLERYDHVAALSVPVHLDGRVWGIVWATKDSGPLASDAMTKATRVAEAIAPMIAIAERLQTMGRLAFEDPL